MEDTNIVALKKKKKRLWCLSTVIGSSLAAISYYFKLEFVAPYDGYILAVIAAFVPPAFYFYGESRRIKKAEKAFPDLLTNLAQAKRTGLPLIEAVKLTASTEGEYGVLTEGIKTISRQLKWGVPFEEGLRGFAKKYPNSQMIKRSIELIIEGYRSGGEVGKVLQIAADDVSELKELEEKRIADMGLYVGICYITFLVFLGVLLVLYTNYIPVMVEAGKKVAETGTSRGGTMIYQVDVNKLKMILFHCAIIEGFCSGFMAGKLGEGKVIAGLKHVVIFTSLAFAAFGVITYAQL